MPFIEFSQVSKDYRKSVQLSGPFRSARQFFSNKTERVSAVREITFSIEPGEVVGYVGPNGAGKSTTIKLLSGVISPTAGVVRVEGQNPARNRDVFNRRVGVVFGHHSQLWWDLPVIDTYNLNRGLYRIPRAEYTRSLEELVAVLDLSELLKKPVRTLSLGQRMRAEIGAAILHQPDILFLDEPTIGLDILARESIRRFIVTQNKERKTTVVLTSHDVEDIETVCNRLIVINHGQIQYDGTISRIHELGGERKTVTIETLEPVGGQLLEGTRLIDGNDYRFRIDVDTSKVSVAEVVSRYAAKYTITNFQVHGADLESVLKKLYRSHNASEN